MALTARLIGKLGGADFETFTVTVMAPFTASCPVGWKSCWAVAQGTKRYPNDATTIFGRDYRANCSTWWSSTGKNHIGGGIALAAGQTSTITGNFSGSVTYIRTG